MDLKRITIGPADPNRHFAAIAALLSIQETEPTTDQSLADWYNRQLEHGIRFITALSPEGRVLGFNGLYRENLNRERLYGLYLIIEQDFRGQGLGSLLYDNLLGQAADLGASTLKTRVRDSCDQGIRFATRRGFVEKKHNIEMMFDLSTWDDQRYDATFQTLQAQGFCFTNMAELGDTQEVRYRLYNLNSNAAATDPGSDGIPTLGIIRGF